MSKKEKNTDTEEITFRRLAFQALPEIWTYQIIAGLLLMIPISFIGNLIEMVTATPEGVFTTANIKDFLLSWRMPVLLVLAAVLAMVYLVSEILGRILLNDDILRGEQQKTARILSDSASSLKRLMNPTGLLLILYILLLAPLCGIGYTVSMSSSFQIPHFIMDVVMASPLLVVLYFAVIVFLIWLGYRFIFVFHAFLLDGMAPADAVRHSAGIVRDKGKVLLKGILLISLKLMLIRLLAMLILVTVPQTVLAALSMESKWIFGEPSAVRTIWSFQDEAALVTFRRSLCIFVIAAGRYLYSVVTLLCSSFFMMRLGDYYRKYTSEARSSYPPRPKRSRYWKKVIFLVAVLAVILTASILFGTVFDEVYALMGDTRIIAHRAGGNMASENSLEGIDAAVEHGCYGSEIDVQRTADGYYIINHDGDFGRLTGVNRKPEEMTLEEVLQLRIKDTTGSGAELKVPTFEEMLQAAMGREILFIELKGATADPRMVDDLVKIIREYDCVKDVVLISLNYDVINYAETNYPEFETGVLFFAGIGDVSELNCDLLLMEEQAATPFRIQKIHNAGKKAVVWTVNTEESMKHFMLGSADAIITDKVEKALALKEDLAARDEYTVILDWMNDILDEIF